MVQERRVSGRSQCARTPDLNSKKKKLYSFDERVCLQSKCTVQHCRWDLSSGISGLTSAETHNVS